MKNYTVFGRQSFVSLLLLTLSLVLNAQITFVPDQVFENYLETHNTNGIEVLVGDPNSMGDGINGNGQVFTSRIQNVILLTLNDLNISNFSGLQDFQSLLALVIENNQTIDPVVIDFSNNTFLESINIETFPNLFSINVSSNYSLQFLTVNTYGDNFINITLPSSPNLTFLDLTANSLSSIDLSGVSEIDSLFLSGNLLTEINLSNLFNLQYCSLSANLFETIDISDNINLFSFFAFGNPNLMSVNAKSGANSFLNQLVLIQNPSLQCILVDDVVYAESAINWSKDLSASYTDVGDNINMSSYAQDLELEFDGLGNQIQVNDWLNNHGNAVASALCGEVTWQNNVLSNFLSDTNFDGAPDRLTVFVEFIAEDVFGDFSSTSAAIIFNNFATAGESAGNGDTICEDTYSVSDFDNDLQFDDGTEYEDARFASSTFSISQIPGEFGGPPGLTYEDSTKKVKFPTTGAGQFTYQFEFRVETTVTIGTETIVKETSTIYTANNVTVALDPGPDITIYVCDFDNLSLSDLYYNELQVQLDVDNTIYNQANDFGNVFEPENLWYNETANLEANPNTPPLSSITEPGVYQFNAKAFLEDCAGKPVYVTIIGDSIETNLVSDQNFEQALVDQAIDLDGVVNGQIETCGIEGIENLSLVSYNITDFSALQLFSGLKEFTLINSQNVINNINFSNNPLLQSLTIINTPELRGFDITQNLNLESLTVITNKTSPFFTFEIDVTQNISLKYLFVPFNQLNSINLTNNINLEFIDLSDNYLYSSIDLSHLNSLTELYIDNTFIDFLDLSNNSQLERLVSNNCSSLEIMNLKNGNNINLQLVDLSSNSQLNCVLVDDANYAASAGWSSDSNTIYNDDSLCSTAASNSSVIFDGVGNQDDVINWLNNNGGAVVYSANNVNWTNNFTVNQIGDEIRYETTFEADDGFDSFTTNARFSIYTSNFYAGADFEPVNGDVAGGIEEEGSLCEEESGTFDLNIFNRTDLGYNAEIINFNEGIYQNSNINYEQVLGVGTGPAGASFEGTVVDFPTTGAGQFSYYYKLTISKDVNFFGTTEPITISDEANIWHWLTVPFDPGQDKVVCQTNITSLEDLYAQFEIIDGTTDSSFNSNDYWFDILGNPITTYSGPGVYVFNAENFLPQCGGKPASVTVIDDCGIDLNLKAFLQGPYDPSSGLMSDDLRAQDLLSTTSPYSDALTCDAAVFNTEGINAIVDWIWVELRDDEDNTTVLFARSALLLRDGTVVDIDGSSPLNFEIPNGNYYVAIKHRNHLGIMTSSTVLLEDSVNLNSIDFSNGSISTFGNNAQVVMSDGVAVLWGGDANGDGKINFIGGSNDSVNIREVILNDPINIIIQFYGFNVNGYYDSDVDLSGSTNIIGSENDAIFLRNNILNHPVNIFLQFYGYNILEQLPENLSSNRMAFDTEMTYYNNNLIIND